MAVIFSIFIILLIGAAISNPPILVPLFLLICIVIYSFVSLKFLINGIDGKKYLGKTLKDLLKINALISIPFAILMISQCIIFIMHPDVLHQLTIQTMKTAGTEVKMDETQVENYLRIVSYFFLVYAIVLGLHILMSFKYLRQYNYLFQNEKSKDQF